MQIRRMLMTMGEDGMRFQKLGTYTIQESWENDTKGNPVTIGETVLDGYVDGFGVYVLEFVGNQVTNSYRVDSIYLPISSATTINAGFFIRNTNAVKTVAKPNSAWATKGTTINIYKVIS